MLRKEGLAARHQVWIPVERPAQEDFAVVAVACPEREPVADDRPGGGRTDQGPKLHDAGWNKGAYRKDCGGPRNENSDQGDGFRQRQQKHDRIGDMRVIGDEGGDGSEERDQHRGAFTGCR